MAVERSKNSSVIHFDGKMLGDLSGEWGERLAVVISGNTEDCRQGKLLSANKISDSKGITQANEVINTLKKWNVSDSVVAQCFDTTSSNTGQFRGAAVKIEEFLERSLESTHVPEHIIFSAL